MRPMDAALYEKFKASGRLPSPKGVALAVMRLLRRDDYKTADLVRLLQSDPAMAGRLLKFANAAAFGNTRPVVAIDKAVLLLGAHRVRDLVLGFSLVHDFRNVGCAAFDFETFWSRALATAIAAQALAKHAQIAAEESFTLGLLCDIGILALAAYDCDRYTEAMYRVGGGGEDTLAAEHAVFGADHRELGAALLADWGLPETLVSAAYHSEAPDAGGLADGSRRHKLALSLYFARALAAVCVAAAPERWGQLPELYAKAARLGIGPEELAPLADDVVRRWYDWGVALKLQTQELPPFAELLASVPPGDVADSPGPRRSAVIIGADEKVAIELAARLAALGYSVSLVANGIDGLMAVLRDRPQLIVVALDSAELDGASFCRAFRANPLSRETHLMLLGSREQEERLIGAVDAGGDDYLLLPVSAATLRVRLRAADKIAHLREEIRRERRSLMRSADELAGSHRRMMEVAFTDLLTRLPNRRYGLDFLAAEWVFAHADGRALACLMVDVDHFKAVNDDYGHDAGDAVLAGVAHILAEHCRSEDMAFRYGGEEFCVVCTDTDLATARIVAERIRGAVELESYASG
ncbi:MAG: HDOD domain-containing protein, partial [Rhodocyclales bacterium]|nr:HDOD domain-containing protein [Rhodocyclales bacterium]